MTRSEHAGKMIPSGDGKRNVRFRRGRVCRFISDVRPRRIRVGSNRDTAEKSIRIFGLFLKHMILDA